MINDPQSEESTAPSDAAAEHVQPESGNHTPDRIVVGISESGAEHYRAALGLAARMSRQRSATITLIHGSQPRLALGASRTEALQRHLARGREVVQEARLALSSMVDRSTHVHAEAVPESGVEALLQESRTAATLILQRRNLSALGRAFTSATSHAVAAQAACPVIVLRHDQLDSSGRGIVVGIGPHSGVRALQVGVLEAALRKCPLTAVHVWDLSFSPKYGGRVDPDEEELAEATQWADSFLASAVAGVAKRHPDLALHARTVRGVTEDGLLQESEHAELLIVERHRDAHLAAIGLGTLTRHLLDHASCPVMITPLAAQRDGMPLGI